MQYLGSFPRDGNFVVDTAHGCVSATSKTLIGNNTTVAVPIFKVKGVVQVLGIWGMVTTVLGANNTAAYLRLNDQTNQSAITLATGTALSAAAVGSLIAKKGLAAAALTLLSASQSRVSEPTTLETDYFSPFVATELPGAETDIEFLYTTTDTPTSGVIKFFIRWLPLSDGANVTGL